MYYAANDAKRALWGWASKRERDEALGGIPSQDWRAVSATEAKALAINSNRISLQGVSERPTWLRTALYRTWRLKRYSNGIVLEKPELAVTYLH